MTDRFASISIQQNIKSLLEKTAYPMRSTYAVAALEDVCSFFGEVPEEALPVLCEYFKVDTDIVRGYTTLLRDSVRTETSAEMKICCGPVCLAHGGAELAAQYRESVSSNCLGACSNAPAALVDGELLAPATSENIRKKLDS